MLASALMERALELDPDYDGTVDDLIAKAMNQTTLGGILMTDEYGSITAECHVCGRQVPVPSTWAASYVMLHQIPCARCAE